jgi:uncharacterized protein (TIGR03437 family)
MAPSAILLFAYATGPEPRHTAAPGDDPLACTSAGCHTGTALNGGGGKVEVSFPNGQTYSPGVAQTFTVTVTDAKAVVYGFQMTARLESNLTNGQAGDFTAGPQQYVICDNNDFKGPAGCPGNAAIQFVEHNTPSRTNSFQVKWTPPATNAGPVHIYVAANAANGDGNNTGDHIYTASYTLTSGGPPSISSVNSAGAFNASAGLASGTWLEIFGTNLATNTRLWGGGDFDGVKAPTSLDGTSVTINGVPAFVDYISPTQVNVQAPDDSTVGTAVDIVVTSGGVKSNAVQLQKKAIAPALLAPDVFVVGGKQYAVAQFPDGTYVGRTGLIGGLNFRPAKAGDVITIYAIGCGPVNPSTPAGTIAPASTALPNPLTFKFGSTVATLAYAGLAPGAVGLYQFNVTVPSVTAGDVPLTVEAAGTPLGQTLFITVQ